MRRVAALALLAALLAACGGTDVNSATSSSTSARPNATTTTLAPVTADDRAEYLQAAERGILDDPRNTDFTDAQARCLARALVNGIGVRRLRAAGVEPDELRRPGYDLPPLLESSLSRAVKRDFGARLQACGLGELFSNAIAASVGAGKNAPAPEELQCIRAAFQAPQQRELLADASLETKPSASSALGLARVLLGCISFGRLVAEQAKADNASLSDDEISCIDRAARASSALEGFLADKIRGRAVDSKRAVREFGVAMALCLTPAHLRQLAGLPPPIISL
jgi:hypothetical protein